MSFRRVATRCCGFVGVGGRGIDGSSERS